MSDAFDAMLMSLGEYAARDGISVDADGEFYDDYDYNDPYMAVGGLNPYKDEDDGSSRTIEVGGGDTKDEKEDVTDSLGLYPEKKVMRSMIKEFFEPYQLLVFEKISRSFSISPNKKVRIIQDKLTEWGIPFAPLNPGTNRFGIQLDGYCMKIALDSDGKTDNKREFIYSKSLYPLVVKCYETSPDGLVAVFEYIEVFGMDDYYKKQETMRDILKQIAPHFLIGDVGISSVNYLNWGYRGEDPCILDYAYIYSTSFQTFRCTCAERAVLHYDNDFVKLICPACGKAYEFKDIRKRISRDMQAQEIGDITEKGYVLSSSEEVVDFVPKFTYGAEDKIRKRLLKIKKRADRRLKKEQECMDPDGMSSEEIIAAIESGEMPLE